MAARTGHTAVTALAQVALPPWGCQGRGWGLPPQAHCPVLCHLAAQCFPCHRRLWDPRSAWTWTWMMWRWRIMRCVSSVSLPGDGMEELGGRYAIALPGWGEPGGGCVGRELS